MLVVLFWFWFVRFDAVTVFINTLPSPCESRFPMNRVLFGNQAVSWCVLFIVSSSYRNYLSLLVLSLQSKEIKSGPHLLAIRPEVSFPHCFEWLY